MHLLMWTHPCYSPTPGVGGGVRERGAGGGVCGVAGGGVQSLNLEPCGSLISKSSLSPRVRGLYKCVLSTDVFVDVSLAL